MGATSTNSPSDLAQSRAGRLVVAGYSTAAAALVAFLTINGASGIPTAATIGTAVLLAIGLLLPAAGMLRLRVGQGPGATAARFGYPLQALGLVGLLSGLVLIVVTATLSGYLVGAVFIMAAGVLAISGAILLRRHYTTAANAGGVACLISGTALIFSGAGAVVASNLAFEYLISQVQNTIYVDAGATVSACGCVLLAYAFFVLDERG